MLFPEEGVWLVNWVLEGGIGGYPNSTYKNTLYRQVTLCFSRGATKNIDKTAHLLDRFSSHQKKAWTMISDLWKYIVCSVTDYFSKTIFQFCFAISNNLTSIGLMDFRCLDIFKSTQYLQDRPSQSYS